MKKTFLVLALSLVSVLGFAQERPSIAVFPFEDMDNIFTQNETVLFYRRFSNAFSNMNDTRFRIIPRQDVDKLIDTEYNFQLTRFSAQAKTGDMNRVLNGAQILSGCIAKLGSKLTISISLYTYPELEQLRGGVDIEFTSKDEIFSSISELVQRITATIIGEDTVSPSANTAAQVQIPIPENFVLVEGGSFQMGKPDGNQTERPTHTVTLKSFYMCKYEVTQREWYEVMGTTIRQQRDITDKTGDILGEGDNYPMYFVNWYEAVDYCNKRSIKEGLTPAYRGSGDYITCDWSANGYRLPTEAEWEFAAKGGTKDYIITEYSGSNNVDAVAWHKNNSGLRAHPVGMKAANSLGIHDMSGNVHEWCWDWSGNYSDNSQTEPKGASSGTYRICRGGDWYNTAFSASSSRRFHLKPGSRGFNVGFRVVRN